MSAAGPLTAPVQPAISRKSLPEVSRQALAAAEAANEIHSVAEWKPSEKVMADCNCCRQINLQDERADPSRACPSAIRLKRVQTNA